MRNRIGKFLFYREFFKRIKRLFLLKAFIILAFCFTVAFNDATGQVSQHPNTGKINEFITKLHDVYGVDDELINGYPYYPPNDLIASHPYFQYQEWRMGSVFMNGETYQNMPIKYDLTKDAIVIKAALKKDVVKLVHLNSLYVDSVMFDQHLFIHSRKYFENDNEETFFEQIYLDKKPVLGYLIHYSKQYLSQYTNIAPKGRFSDTKEKRFLLKEGKLLEANNRKNFLKSFNQHQRALIRNYMRKHDIKYKRASNKQLYQLMEHCHGLLID